MKTEVYNGNTGTILTNDVVPWGASVIKNVPELVCQQEQLATPQNPDRSR